MNLCKVRGTLTFPITLCSKARQAREYRMTKLRKITQFQVSFDCDHNQYWPGHGISLTPYTDCATGIGNTLRDAFGDAIGQLAEAGYAISDKLEVKMLKELASQLRHG